MSNSTPERRIKFLSRDLPFPTDPTFREYRVVEELTGVTAEKIMTGQAGVWMLPILAIVAMIRSDKNITHSKLEKLIDLRPQDIEITGINFDLDDEEEEASPDPLEIPSTGSESTDATSDKSGTPDSPTTSPEPQGSQKT